MVEQHEGRFPQVSGLRFHYDPAQPAGSRVWEVTIGEKPLEDAAEYTLALQFDSPSPDEEFEKLAARLRPDLEKVLGDGAQLHIRRALEIPHSVSGKFLSVQNLHCAQ